MKIQRKTNGSNRNIARLGWLCVCVLYSHLILYICNTTWKWQIAVAYGLYKYVQWHVLYIHIERMKPNLQLKQYFNWTLWMQRSALNVCHIQRFLCISLDAIRSLVFVSELNCSTSKYTIKINCFNSNRNCMADAVSSHSEQIK